MVDRADKEQLMRTFEAFASTRDPKLRDELIEAHLGLAEYLARRFANRGEPLDDLVQVASLGLVKAVERFDPERGLEFTTFATPTIVGELKRHFRDKGWAVRVPRRVQELHLRVTRVIDDLATEFGRSPTVQEIARVTRRWSSWTRRGTRTAQPLSRKWRLSSPTIVGVANVVNSSPRSGSKRSTAFTRPSDATWTRSSSGSPRLAKRRARYSARPRCASISWSRSAASRVEANASNVRMRASLSARSSAMG